jgi:hypothetical protein
MPPPEDYPIELRNGRDYVRGEVYLSKTVESDFLIPLGFEEINFHASAVRYNSYEAVWPLELNLDSLPPEITGINYNQEFSAGSNTIVMSGSNDVKMVVRGGLLTMETKDGRPVSKFPDAFPSQPDTILFGEEYAEGRVYLTFIPDTARLSLLGFLYYRIPRASEVYDMRYFLRHYETHKSDPNLNTKVTEFITAWPMDLNLEKLPKSVAGLICDYKLSGGIPGNTSTRSITIEP